MRSHPVAASIVALVEEEIDANLAEGAYTRHLKTCLIAHSIELGFDGMTLPDGRRLLGDHKTWRGLVAAVFTCALAAAVLGYPLHLGIAFALLALTGDAASSRVRNSQASIRYPRR